MNSRHRNFLAILGILVVIYSVSVLAFVITSPDLRLRWLVSAPDQVSLPSQGVPIWTVEGIQVMGEQPRDEDVLLEVADKPIHTYLDLAEVMFDLYLPKEDPSGSNLLSENSDPSELPEDWIAPVVQIHNGPRMAEIRFQSMSEPGQPVHRAFVVIQSLPWNEMIPTIVWFLIQLSIFAVAGIAFWNRPFDASTQMFYIVCMFGLGAFVGGFHWWMIGGSPFMNAPFIIMGLFLPAVLLHFFPGLSTILSIFGSTKKADSVTDLCSTCTRTDCNRCFAAISAGYQFATASRDIGSGIGHTFTTMSTLSE